MRKTLYIGNLKSRQDGVKVKQLLSNTGKVLHFKMMVHEDMRHHDGFAIVEMEDECDAIAAAGTLNGTAFQGTTLEVRVASAIEESASGHPRIFGEMNMPDDPAAPTNAAKRKNPGDRP